MIAALLLALLWTDYHSRATLTERDLETAAFTVFLYGRMIGAAAEIDDHLNRGRNMDTRTPRGGVRVRDVSAQTKWAPDLHLIRVSRARLG